VSQAAEEPPPKRSLDGAPPRVQTWQNSCAVPAGLVVLLPDSQRLRAGLVYAAASRLGLGGN